MVIMSSGILVGPTKYGKLPCLILIDGSYQNQFEDKKPASEGLGFKESPEA